MPSRVNFAKLRKEQFPHLGLSLRTNGRRKPVRTMFLDSAATTPASRFVNASMRRAKMTLANVHRGSSEFSRITSHSFDQTRRTAMKFIGAEQNGNYAIFVKNNTEGLNLAAHLMRQVRGMTLVSEIEHHSNILPHRERGKIDFFRANRNGALDFNDLEAKLRANKGRVKLVAITGASNVTGFMPDIHKAARLAHRYGAKILVDAAQLGGHVPIDVRRNNSPSHIDLAVIGSHKIYGPGGAGFLFCPAKTADAAHPFLPGGGTVVAVTKKRTVYLKGPERHEGGTQDILGTIGLRAAMVGIQRIGRENIREHEKKLISKALAGLKKIPGLKIYGNFGAEKRVGVISFTIKGIGYAELAEKINKEGAQIRDGCFCAHTYVHKLLGMTDAEKLVHDLEKNPKGPKPGLVRVSFGVYTVPNEIDAFLKIIKKIAKQAAGKAA